MELGRFPKAMLHVDTQQIAVVILGAIIGQVLIRYYLRKRPLPNGSRPLDGPPGKPLVGNLFDVPPYHSWLKFFDWSKQYGPLYQLNLAGQNHVIISTEDIANDLLRERGNIYSSRPHFPMASELLSCNLRPLLIPYGETFRQNRKLIHALINVKVSETYEPLQQEESVRAVRDLLNEPRKYETWFERYSAGLILRLAYSKPVVTGQESTVRRVMNVVHTLEDMLSPGAYLVDLLPILMRLPSFLAPFKREGKRAHEEEISLFRDLLQQGVNSGKDNFCTQWYNSRQAYKMSDDHVAYVIGTLFEAGAGTTSAAMCSFMLAMTLHSKEYALLQEEIDSVVGPDRLPTFEDMPNLPRVRAVAKEVMRWRPVTAGGMPHMLTKDDTYKLPNGETAFLPAGSTVHAVQWAIHREPKLYPDAESFRPERWLEPGWPTYKEPLDKFPTLHNFSAFGFGRRICPGMNITERSMFILVSRVAWAASIVPKVDAKGTPKLPPEYDYVTGANVQPKPFDFDLKPRPGRQAIIEKECDAIWAPNV